MTQQRKIPTSRLSRLSTIGGFVAKVAGNVVLDGAKQLSKGKSPSLKNLIVQPKNIEQLADKLSELRGAAMKVGQLLSMDAGDLLPPELSMLLEKLRADAPSMPHKQLLDVLEREWGEQWLDNFSHFELTPFASASIGQVHLAFRESGEKLAVKVQYPSVDKAIGSDVDNVAALLKMSGLLPSHIQIDDLLDEAKKQLLAEADYLLEAEYLMRFQQALTCSDYALPKVDTRYSTRSILVMDFIEGVPVDKVLALPQSVRDNLASRLIGLFFAELFTFKLMQTDPNFANYLYQQDTDKIVLLDFGATREIPNKVSLGYQRLISAGAANDKAAMVEAAQDIGFFADNIDEGYLQQVLTIFTLACEPLTSKESYHFAESGLAERIKDEGLNINKRQDQWHTPPVDAIFIHRKLAGLYLLSAKLKARVNVNHLFAPYMIRNS